MFWQCQIIFRLAYTCSKLTLLYQLSKIHYLSTSTKCIYTVFAACNFSSCSYQFHSAWQENNIHSPLFVQKYTPKLIYFKVSLWRIQFPFYVSTNGVALLNFVPKRLYLLLLIIASAELSDVFCTKEVDFVHHNL